MRIANTLSRFALSGHWRHMNSVKRKDTEMGWLFYTDRRVNAVQNEARRGGKTFSIIPFIESGEREQDAGAGLSLVA